MFKVDHLPDTTASFPNHDPGVSDRHLAHWAFQFNIYSYSLERNFQNKLKELEDYVDRILKSDDIFVSPIFTSSTANLIEQSKEVFRKSVAQVVEEMKTNFEHGKKIHFFPETYLSQLIENTKQEIFISYNHLMQNIELALKTNSMVETLALLPEHDMNIPPTQPVRQKLKPGKTKFPKKARQVLDSWYKSHSDDPFPSYTEKLKLAEESGVTVKQVKCWFINMRRKHWNNRLNDDDDFKIQIEQKLMQNIGESRNNAVLMF